MGKSVDHKKCITEHFARVGGPPSVMQLKKINIHLLFLSRQKHKDISLSLGHHEHTGDVKKFGCIILE